MSLKDVKVESTLRMVSKYMDKEVWDEAKALIPIDRIWSDAIERLRKAQMDSVRMMFDESIYLEKCFLEEFVSWFKNEFFSWFDTPYCDRCNISDCVKVMNVTIHEPHIDNTEVFECRSCHSSLFFERYNDPYILLKTRKGRCSEFTQVFTVMCFAIGYEARFIYDTNDHAWTEVYSILQGRWIHCDPSEGVIDKPLMYELGWGKKPKLIMSFSPTMEVQDVTWRYSCNHKAVLSRREPDTNDLLLSVVSRHNKLILDNCSPYKRRFLFKRLIGELAELMMEPQPTETYIGRLSGSLEWRDQRGELELPELHTGYIFTLRLDDFKVKPRFYSMWYSANKDSYIFYCDNGKSQIKKGWRSCMYSFSNITRKEELDWGQTYLAREKNGKPGKITWKFDVGHFHYIKGLHVKTNSFFLDNGVVEVKVFNNQNRISFKNGAEFDCYSLSPENTLSVEVNLRGGKGTASWQQAQIGRQSIDEGSAVSFGVVLYLWEKNN